MHQFYHWLNDFRNFVPRTEETEIKKKIVYNTAWKLYNKLLSTYFNQYNNIANKEHMDEKYDPANLLLQGQRFNLLKKEEKSKSQPEETIAERVKLKNTK